MAYYTGIRPTRAGVLLMIGVVVLTALITFGLFWVKNTAEQARRDEAVKIAEQNLEEQSDEGVALNEGDDSNTESSNESTGEQSESNTESQSNSSSNSSSSQQSATELPQTGIEDVAPLFIIGLLTFSVSAYIVSRRQLA
jgi:LPXTG-motif cell wall-anchored protein